MSAHKSIVMLKPDSIVSTVPKTTAYSLYRAFANHICKRDFYHLSGDYLRHEEAAKKQVKERSFTEISFQGEINLVPNVDIIELANRMDSFKGSQLAVHEVIEAGIKSLGYVIRGKKQYILLPQDVIAIYRLEQPNSNLNFEIASRLHSYLDNKMVILLMLESQYGDFVLQHWKTYVRHFLIVNRIEKFPLMNLVHVCEDELEYVEHLFLQQ